MEKYFFDRLERVMFDKRIATQKKLSEITGIDNGTISRWKKEKITPRDESIKKISDTVGCNFDFLKYGSGEIYTPTTTTHSPGSQILSGSTIHTNQAAGGNFYSPVHLTDGVQLNAMEQDLIDTMRRGNLSDWTKISAILDDIKGRG